MKWAKFSWILLLWAAWSPVSFANDANPGAPLSPLGSLPPVLSPSCLNSCAAEQLTADQCTKRCGGGQADLSGGGSSGGGINQIVNTGTTAYYGGVIQISAGITQVSRSAQDRTTNGPDTSNRTELVQGLQNIQSGNESVQEARQTIDYANSLLAKQANNGSVGTSGSTQKFGLSFDPSKAGELGRSVLSEMEKVAGVTTESLLNAVKDPEYVYDLAAGAKGMDVSGSELKEVAEAANAKAGKPTNPEIAPGATMADLMKDLDMFMAKKDGEKASTLPASDAKPVEQAAATGSPAAKEPAAVQPADRKPAAQQASEPNYSFAGLGDEALPSIAAELAKGGDQEPSLFQRIHRQYGKRHQSFVLARPAL